MQYLNRNWFDETWLPVFENEPATEPKPDPKGGDGKTFTQEDVNRIMAENKRALQEKNTQLVAELETLRKSTGLSANEKSTLEKRIESLQNEVMSKDELARKEREKLQQALEKQLKEATELAGNWQTKYTEAAIQRSIIDAAVTNEAVNARQILALLRPAATVDEGDVVKVKFDTKDKDGKPVVLDLTPAEAVKQMRDMEDYFNLFKGEGSGGAGGTHRSSAKGLDVKDAAKDPALYRKLRKEGKLNF